MSKKKEHPNPPILTHLAEFLDKLPPWIARKKVGYFTGGVIAPKSLANADSKGTGPRVRQVINGTIAYPTPYLLEYLEKLGVRTIVVPNF